MRRKPHICRGSFKFTKICSGIELLRGSHDKFGLHKLSSVTPPLAKCELLTFKCVTERGRERDTQIEILLIQRYYTHI